GTGHGPAIPDPIGRGIAARQRVLDAFQGPEHASREVAWPPGRRNALPAALRRPDRECRDATRVRAPQPDHHIAPPLPRQPWVSRSRDAGPAAALRRRGGATLRDASQHAGPGVLPADRGRALPEAAPRRRL